MRADPATTRDVLAVIDQLRWVYTERRVQEARRLFSAASDITLINVGTDDEAIGWEQIQAGAPSEPLDPARALPAMWKRRWVSAQGDVAWASGEASTEAATPAGSVRLDSRFTAVLVREDGAWKLHTLHVSRPAPSANRGAAAASRDTEAVG